MGEESSEKCEDRGRVKGWKEGDDRNGFEEFERIWRGNESTKGENGTYLERGDRKELGTKFGL